MWLTKTYTHNMSTYTVFRLRQSTWRAVGSFIYYYVSNVDDCDYLLFVVAWVIWTEWREWHGTNKAQIARNHRVRCVLRSEQTLQIISNHIGHICCSSAHLCRRRWNERWCRTKFYVHIHADTKQNVYISFGIDAYVVVILFRRKSAETYDLV